MSEPAPSPELTPSTGPQPVPEDPLAGAELLSDALRSEMRAAAGTFGEPGPRSPEPEPLAREEFLLTSPVVAPKPETAPVPEQKTEPVPATTAELPREIFVEQPPQTSSEPAALPEAESFLQIAAEQPTTVPVPVTAPAPWSVKAIAASARGEPMLDVPSFPVLSRMAQLMVPPPEEETEPQLEAEDSEQRSTGFQPVEPPCELGTAPATDAAEPASTLDISGPEPEPEPEPAHATGPAPSAETAPVSLTTLLPDAGLSSTEVSPLFAAAALSAGLAAADHASPLAAADAAVPAPAGPNDSPGLVLLGGVLSVCGLALAVRIPVLLMGNDPGYAGTGPLDTALRQSAAVLHGAGAAALLALGLGAATARRWAPPLIHGAGWAVLLGTLLILAQYSGLLFHGAGASGPDVSGGFGRLAFVTACGIIFPLLAVAYCDRQRVLETCAAADPKPRWTDPLPVPVLMLFCTALIMAAICAAAAAGPLPFPLGETAGPAPLWWGAAALWLVSAVLCMRRARAAWLLALTGFLGLAAVGVLAFRTLPLQAVLSGAGSDPAAPVALQPQDFAAWATLLLPLLVILLMTRRAFGKS